MILNLLPVRHHCHPKFQNACLLSLYSPAEEMQVNRRRRLANANNYISRSETISSLSLLIACLRTFSNFSTTQTLFLCNFEMFFIFSIWYWYLTLFEREHPNSMHIYVVNRSSSKIKARACRVTNLQSTIERTHEGRNLELLSSNPGPPTKSPSRPEVCVKILFQLHYYFPRYGHHMAVMAIWKFGLKRLFPPPTFAFWEGFDPKHYF